MCEPLARGTNGNHQSVVSDGVGGERAWERETLRTNGTCDRRRKESRSIVLESSRAHLDDGAARADARAGLAGGDDGGAEEARVNGGHDDACGREYAKPASGGPESHPISQRQLANTNVSKCGPSLRHECSLLGCHLFATTLCWHVAVLTHSLDARHE